MAFSFPATFVPLKGVKQSKSVSTVNKTHPGDMLMYMQQTTLELLGRKSLKDSVVSNVHYAMITFALVAEQLVSHSWVLGSLFNLGKL